jgi:ATP-dependent Lon protease
MKNYMANKSFSRGVETLGAEASMVFIGNTSHTVPYMLKNSDLFDELPEAYHDPAYLDRLHHYIPGWEVDIIRGEMFSNGYGFVVDYIAEVLKSMRSQDYSDRYQQHFTLSPDISTRDRDGIHKTFSGLMKILYPDGQATKEEIEEILRFAIEGRKRVKDQILRIDSTMPEVKFGYLDSDGTWHAVATLEEDQYPAYYYVERDTEERNEPELARTGADPLGGGAAAADGKPVDEGVQAIPEPELFQGHRDYQEGQRGVSFDSLLVPYLRGASQITIVDPYVRMFHQARNLMELVEGIARGKDPADEVVLKLVTVENQDGPEKLQRQLEYLLQIKKSAGVLGIVFDTELVDPQVIHDRSITTDTGWKILLGRGLDIFQRMVDSPFDLATKYQKYREVKGFGITYLRESARIATPATQDDM